MLLNRESMTKALHNLINQVFSLPEITYIRIRDIIIKNDDTLSEKIELAMDRSYHDCYSDVDLYVNVKLSAKDTITPVEYMKRIDRLGIKEEECLGIIFSKENRLYRIVLKNGMRYDLGFEFEFNENIEYVKRLPQKEIYNNPNWPIKNINSFWFIQIQALGKLYRKDYLIADHLANMNLNETLVQQMVLRDIKYGTNIHRYGHEEELVYLKYQDKCPLQTENDTFNLIADKLYCAALTYDALTKYFYPDYESRTSDFWKIWKCYETNQLK